MTSRSDDPLASLHKMSTTAGLGSTDYVAVNPTAIFALCIGVASAITLFDEPLLLLIPLVGVVSAIIAFRQISRSNGTQTGVAIAAIAIMLSLLFGGIVFARTLVRNVQYARDKQEVGKLIANFGEQIKAGNFDAAYQLFSPRFRQRVSQQQFTDVMKFAQNSSLYGKLQQATWKGLAEFQTDETTGAKVAAAYFILQFDKGNELREQAVFRLVEGQWKFDDVPAWFPSQKPPQ